MVTLEEIALELRDNGFPKHATLLASEKGRVYADCLTKPQWYKKVREAFGFDIVRSLEDFLYSITTPEDLLIAGMFPDSDFTPRNYSEEPLTVANEKPFTWDSITQTYTALNEIHRLTKIASRLIWSDFQSQFGDDEDTLYRVIKDEDAQINDPTNQDFNDYRRLVKERLKLFRTMEMFGESSTLNAQYYNLLSLLPLVCKSEGIDPVYAEFYQVNQDVEISFDEDMGDDEIDLLMTEGLEYNPETLQRVLGAADQLIENEALLEKSFLAYWNQRGVTHRQRVIKNALTRIKDKLEIEKFPLSFENEINLKLDHENYADLDFDLDNPYQIDELADLVRKNPGYRKSLVDDFNIKRRHRAPQRVGMEQILAGGQITNPLKDSLSVGQNDGKFPNIKYQPETMKKLTKIVDKIKAFEEDLANVSDILVPKQVRNKKQLTYKMSEMSKNPLDITFGNQSGCCIFVSDEPDKMQNGGFIPIYLSSNYIRLFEIERVRQNSNSRMGFVMTYDTITEDGDRIFTVNSLELSQKGIAGGKKTLDELTNYVEKWLIGYAKEAGYAGVVMGNHSYNTSVNHSSRSSDVVQEKLTFEGSDLFYSDIFHKNRNNKLETRKKSCYWLADFRD